MPSSFCRMQFLIQVTFLGLSYLFCNMAFLKFLPVFCSLFGSTYTIYSLSEGGLRGLGRKRERETGGWAQFDGILDGVSVKGQPIGY